MTGVDYPRVTVRAHENITVKMSLAAQLLMPRRGLNPMRIGEALAPVLVVDGKLTQQPNQNAVANYITAFSCMVCDAFIDLSHPHKVDLDSVPTADYWATQIEDFSLIESAVNDALKKAAEERRKRLAAVPPAEAAS